MLRRSNVVSGLERTALYRHFDANGALLYVGISLSVVNRLAQHRDGSPWYEQIATVAVEWFDNRAAAHAAERKAIREECPLHNRVRYSDHHQEEPAEEEICTPPEPGTYQLSQQERDRIVALFCTPRCRCDSIAGIAANLGLDADYLSRFVEFDLTSRSIPAWEDMLVIADRLCRGTLVSEAPWIIGSPLPERNLSLRERRQRRQSQPDRVLA